MTEPFLILHKVRGEPSFDIAVQIGEDSDGPLWIIPTSGHRAYPYRRWSLNELEHYQLVHPLAIQKHQPIPLEWPDHYSCNDQRPSGHEVTAKPKRQSRPTLSLLEELLS